MNACSVVTAQPSSAPATESRWRGVSHSLSDGPTKIVKSTVTQDRKSSFTRQRQLSDTAFNHLCLTRFVSGAGEVGKPTEYATYRQGDSLGWLHRSGVATGLPAMHSSNGPLFHAGSSTKTPLAPIPKIGCNITNGSDPESSPSHEHGFGIPSCGEPNQLAPRPYRPRGNDQSEAEARLLAGAQRSSFPVCIRPVRERTAQTREPLIFPLGDCNGRGDRLWRSCPRLGIVHHAGRPSPARWNMLDQATCTP